MTTRSAAVAAALIAALAAPAARADAGPAEARFRREGFAVGVALGPNLVAGAPTTEGGLAAAGGLSLRVGTVSDERLSWVLQLDSAAHAVQFEDAASGETTTRPNTLSLLTLGAQYYLREVLWLRAGVGLAGFVEQTGIDESERHGGLGVSAGGGYDLFRRGIFALDLEALATMAVVGGEPVGQLGVLLGFNWY